ncbi:MAG: beta-N-acetylhexosaminidase [Clostridia bacterium]|nr:beta-N-acetylhexosaminidase [Clostridia bacterium]
MKRYGVMLDCSRNAVMKVSEVKRFMDCMKKMGYNALELYTEDTYELDGEPYFGYMRGRYTGAEIREMDAYAKAHGIELIPCIQTLAHFTAIVRHSVYRDIVDVNDILVVDEPKTYALIEKMFASLAENFSSRQVNIGMDEAHLMGRGKFLDKFGYQDRFDVLLRHLRKVVSIAEKYGFQVHMWSDMFFRLANHGDAYGKNVVIPAEIVSKIPQGVSMAYWDYYHYKQSDYDEMFRAYARMGCPIWFFGSVWTCCGFVPLWDKVLQTMKPAMKSAREHGIEDIFLCAWGDGGKECSYFAALPLLYAAKQYADGNFDEEKIAASFKETFGLCMTDFELLSKINGVKSRREYFSSTHLYNDPLLGINDCFVKENGAVPYAEYTAKLHEAKARAGEFAYVFDCAEKLSAVLELKYDFGVRLREGYHAKSEEVLRTCAKECQEIVLRTEDFYESLKTLWHIENKPFGFEVQTLRIGAVLQRMKDCKIRIEEYLEGRAASIPELEEEPLPHPEYDAQYLTLFSAGKV